MSNNVIISCRRIDKLLPYYFIPLYSTDIQFQMEQYSSIIFCSDRAFKAVIMVLSISLVMILSFFFLHAHSFAYLGMNENVPHLIYDHNSSSLRPFISELGT